MKLKKISFDTPEEFSKYENKFDYSSLGFNFKMSETDYQLDVIQNQLLQLYLRQDKRFRRAFNINFTPHLITYFKDKTRLNEPISIATMGEVRSGKSLIPKTKVLYSENNHLKVMAIKDLFDVYKINNKILTPSINLKNNKIELKEILEVTKHHYKDKIYKIYLNSGRIIEATKDHSFLILNKESNEIKQEKGENLKVDDFVPIANNLPFKEILKEIQILKYFNNKNSNKLHKKLDKPLKLDWDFGYFLGCFISEGCLTYSPNNAVYITNNDSTLIKPIKKFLKKIGLGFGENYDKRRSHKALICFSSVMADFLRVNCFDNELRKKNYGNKGYYSSLKILPDFTFFSPIEFKKGLLNGLFSGDGYLGYSGTKINLEYTSKSKKLIEEIGLLLINLGYSITYRRKVIKSGNYKGNTYYIVNIKNRNILKFINEIGFNNKLKNDISKKIKNRYKKIQENFIEKINLQEFYFSKIKKIKDLIFDKIIRIETYDYDDLVYDLSIKDNENFMLSNGAFVHNSYSMLTLCVLHQALYRRLFHPFYICANAFEFIDKLQKTPKERLLNRIFLIDEEKQSVYGVGSVAKKMKISDVANIVAINNISTIQINPTKWQSGESSQYGLRAFGRCFNTKTVRLMLYNLQEKASGGLPMGILYLPIFTKLLENEYGEWLEEKYLEKKNKWVDMERRGEGDVLETLKKKTAINFTHDPKYMELKRKKDRINYIRIKMGSEWTNQEIEVIEGYTKLLREGMIDEDELKDKED